MQSSYMVRYADWINRSGGFARIPLSFLLPQSLILMVTPSVCVCSPSQSAKNTDRIFAVRAFCHCDSYFSYGISVRRFPSYRTAATFAYMSPST